MPRSRRGWLAVGLVAIGGLLGGLGGAGLVKAQSPAAATVVYRETAACTGCPAGISIDSVEVQARQGSTLFIVGGKWPASVDGLHNNVRLRADKTEVVLKPHGSQNAFEIVSATSNGGPLPAAGLAASITGGALLINVSPALNPPLTFEFGLWDGSQYSGRIPRSGTLGWDGKSAPTKPAATAASGQTPSPQTTGTTSAEVTPLAAACTSITASAPVPPYLAFTQLSSSTPAPDPRTQVPARSITAGLSASALDVTAPFAMIAIVSRGGDKAPAGQSRPVDRAGTEQLYLYLDGTTKHKAVRTFHAGVWTTVQDAAAGSLTYALKADQITFFWSGLNAGDRFGFISASSGSACAESGLDAQLQPTVTAQ